MPCCSIKSRRQNSYSIKNHSIVRATKSSLQNTHWNLHKLKEREMKPLQRFSFGWLNDTNTVPSSLVALANSSSKWRPDLRIKGDVRTPYVLGLPSTSNSVEDFVSECLVKTVDVTEETKTLPKPSVSS